MKKQRSVIVCINHRANPGRPSCAARGSRQIADMLETALEQAQLPVTVQRVYCLGHCESGPVLRIAPGGRFYTDFAPQQINELLNSLTCPR